MEKHVLSKKLRTAAAFLFFCVSLFVFSAQSFSQKAVPCKDCGSLGNCWNGNGLNSGYRNCVDIIHYNDDGSYDIVGCNVRGWGDCS